MTKQEILERYGKSVHQIQLEIATAIYLARLGHISSASSRFGLAWTEAAEFVRLLEEQK